MIAKLEETKVEGAASLHAAIESVRFRWNLARHQGKALIVAVYEVSPDTEKEADLMYGYGAD